ncbi:MAG: hypothetical protein M3478_07365 [Planctomycetota bacterium]|nr:hypothetical protein [Planctomycetota bacterium]
MDLSRLCPCPGYALSRLCPPYSSSSIFIGDYQNGVVQFQRDSTLTTPDHSYTGTTSTFGMQIAVSGNRLLVTAPAEQKVIFTSDGELASVRTGAAYVFDHTTYEQVQRIVNPTPDMELHGGIADTFGLYGVGVFGDGSFAIADPSDDDGSLIDVGAVYTFDA